MNYNWTKLLASDETLQSEFSVSKRFLNILLFGSLLIAIAVCFVAWYVGIVLFLLLLLFWFYMKKSKHYAFTNKRVLLVDSLIGESIVSIDYTQITDIVLEQSAIGQLGGWGSITVNTAGNNAPSYVLSFIENPQQAKQLLDTIRDTGHTGESEVPQTEAIE